MRILPWSLFVFSLALACYCVLRGNYAVAAAHMINAATWGLLIYWMRQIAKAKQP